MDVGDLFPEGEVGFYATPNSIRIIRIFHQLMRRIDNQAECFSIYKKAMGKATKSIYTILHELYGLRSAHGRDGSKDHVEPEEKRKVSTDQLDELEKIATEKLHIWAGEGTLAEHRNLPRILFSWKRLEGSPPVDDFVSDLVKTDDGLVKLIAAFLQRTYRRGLSDHVAKLVWRLNLEALGEFIPIQETATRLRLFSANPQFDKLDEHKKLAIQIFLGTVDGKIDDRF
jgi:predicted KAP-like P-loop ATPase